MARRAFTLTELAVSIAIVATLSSFSMPVVVRLRGAAEATHCRNNLRQLALALHNYHGRCGRFPPGMIRHEPPHGIPPPPAPYCDYRRYTGFWPWTVFILPDLEQSALFAGIDWRSNPWSQSIGSASLPTVRCPSDVRAENRYTTGGYNQALASYLGVNGRDQFAQDGVLTVNGRTRIEDVHDGTSQTLLIGERPPSFNGWWGWWAGGMGESPDYLGTNETLLGAAERAAPGVAPDAFGPGTLHDPADEHRWHFWSMHAGGGAHFALADGSVRLMCYSTARVLPAMATRGSGEVIQLP